jgi:F-type H+-transporting ATPase subunit delta
MMNPRLAARYAKSLIDLSVETNQLEKVYEDQQYMLSMAQSNKQFVLILKSPVINSEKKLSILEALTIGRVSKLTSTFNQLLVKKGREANLPEIAKTFIQQYKHLKEIQIIKLRTAIPATEELKQEIVAKVRKEFGLKNVEVETEVDESLIGGFVLEIGDRLIDASISYDLNAIRKQFLNNDFVYKIR